VLFGSGFERDAALARRRWSDQAWLDEGSGAISRWTVQFDSGACWGSSGAVRCGISWNGGRRTAAGALEFIHGVTPHALGRRNGAVQRFEAGEIFIKHFGHFLFFEEFGLEVVIFLEPEPGSGNLMGEQRLFGGRGLVGAHDFVTNLSEAGSRRGRDPRLDLD
jgi:hypothetical protein